MPAHRGTRLAGSAFRRPEHRLRNIVSEQLDPAIIAISKCGSFHASSARAAIHSNIRRKRASNFRRDRAASSLLHNEGMQTHLRDENVIPRGSLTIASIRIGLQQNLPLHRSPYFSQPPLHSRTLEICRQGG